MEAEGQRFQGRGDGLIGPPEEWESRLTGLPCWGLVVGSDSRIDLCDCVVVPCRTGTPGHRQGTGVGPSHPEGGTCPPCHGGRKMSKGNASETKTGVLKGHGAGMLQGV